jgi:AraC-like DNA-binding protein
MSTFRCHRALRARLEEARGLIVLWANGTHQIHDCFFANHVGLERTLRVWAVERRGLVWDTRFMPPRATEGPGYMIVYLVLDGRATWAAPWALDCGPGSAFVASERHLYGAGGERPCAFRSIGDPFRAVEIGVEATYAIAGAPPEPRPLCIGEPLRASCLRFFGELGAAPDATGATRELLGALVDASILHRDLIATVRGEEPPHFVRCWRAIAQHYLRIAPSPSLQDLADAAGVSLRQLARDLEELVEAFPVGTERFRGLVSDVRLRWAVLLLSAPSLPIARVAHAAGFGSVQALGRALRNAGLPTPSAIRRDLLAP